MHALRTLETVSLLFSSHPTLPKRVHGSPGCPGLLPCLFMVDWTVGGRLARLGQLDSGSGNLGLRYSTVALQVAIPARIIQCGVAVFYHVVQTRELERECGLPVLNTLALPIPIFIQTAVFCPWLLR